MLKMRIEGASKMELEITGAFVDIVSELTTGIKVMRDKFEETDEGMGDEFIHLLKKGIDFIEMDEDETDDLVNKAIDHALEDEDFLDFLTDNVLDELKDILAKKLVKRAKEKKK